MVDHKIDYDVDAPGVGLGYEFFHIVEVSELGIDIIIVFDIVFVVAGSFRYRHEPDSVETHVLYVIEFCRDSVEVSDSVVVGIEERSHVDFVVVAARIVYGTRFLCGRGRLLLCLGARGEDGKDCKNKKNGDTDTVLSHSRQPLTAPPVIPST